MFWGFTLLGKAQSKLSLLDKPTEQPHPISPKPSPEAQAIEKDITSRRTPLELSTIQQVSVLAMLDTGLSENVIADHIGVSNSTVNEIRHNERLRYLLTGNVERVKKSLPAMLYEAAVQGISSITMEEIKKLNPLQRMTMAAIGIDKARLLEGLTTENIGIVPLVNRIQDEIQSAREQQAQLIELINKGNDTYEPVT